MSGTVGYLRFGDLKGNATEKDHKDWIEVAEVFAAITRSIPPGAKDQHKTRGETTLGDITIRKPVDRTTPKFQEYCAGGKMVPEVEIDIVRTADGKVQPYLKYVLHNVLVTSYAFEKKSNADLNEESVSFTCSSVEWTYLDFDPNTNAPRGSITGKYNPSGG